MTLKNKLIAGLLGLVALLGGASTLDFGSVSQGSEYMATSTKDQLGNTLADLTVLQNTQGTLGSVVITGANTGTFMLIDATTTNATLRTNTATTVLAVFPTNTAAGTYTFDSVFRYGLLIDWTTNLASSTITWRAR